MRLEAERDVLWDLENLRILEALYSDTGNPLFIWDAITVLNHLRSLALDGIKVPDHPPMPEWVLRYITQAAIQITKLANRDLDKGAKSPLQLVPHMLGLNPKRNTNSFVEYQAKRRCLDTLTLFEEAQAAGKTSAQAYEVIRQKYGHKDLSVIQRQIAKGGTLRKQIIAYVNQTISE